MLEYAEGGEFGNGPIVSSLGQIGEAVLLPMKGSSSRGTSVLFRDTIMPVTAADATIAPTAAATAKNSPS